MGRTATLKSQRRLARTILAMLTALLLAFVLFASDPLGAVSFAQGTPTQTGSPTYTINFLNPSGHAEEISAKPDGSDGESADQYHLVAWVNQLPPDATVEFRYNDPDQNNNEVTIGVAAQTSTPDTFELYWAPPPEVADDSAFTMHAVLFSGGSEVARDTESDVNLNNQTAPNTETQGETVEITDPTNGDSRGFFTPRDRATNTVINVTSSAQTIYVRVFYTTSAPGTEPAWRICGTELRAASADGVRCTVAATDDASDITAVGAVANDTNRAGGLLGYSAAADDSGDAHRIAPYEQIPTTLTLTPAQQNELQPNACSGDLTATLTDQNGQPIANANVDGHAAGPTDGLAFDSSGTTPPQQGHNEEAAVDCSSADPDNGVPPEPDGFQGDHNLPEADIKHVETPSGTNDAGLWVFALYSPDRGGTQITVWSDLDEDDVFCSSEVNADASIGWQEPAPAVSGVPEETSVCPSPSPSSPGPSPSESTPDPTPTDDPRGCTVFGTSSGEQLDGTPGRDVICAYGGNDVIRGFGGNDVIYGDGGRDTISAGVGNDVVHGGSGRNTIRGEDGDDALHGGGRNDLLAGGRGNDRLNGRRGFDTLRGGGGRDRLVGALGDDILRGGRSNDRLFGGRGRDILVGGSGHDQCSSGPGRDEVRSCE